MGAEPLGADAPRHMSQMSQTPVPIRQMCEWGRTLRGHINKNTHKRGLLHTKEHHPHRHGSGYRTQHCTLRFNHTYADLKMYSGKTQPYTDTLVDAGKTSFSTHILGHTHTCSEPTFAHSYLCTGLPFLPAFSQLLFRPVSGSEMPGPYPGH